MIRGSSKKKVDPEELFEDRWTAFGKSGGILEISQRLSVEQLRAFEIFQSYDDALLEKISPDVSVAIWDRGKILFEEGSYIDLAFFVVKGQVNVCVTKQQAALANGLHKHSKNRPAGSRNGRDGGKPPATVFQTQIKQLSQNPRLTFLSSMDIDVAWGDVLNLGPGEIFGETGASIGWPQSVTAQTTTQCLLVQIRVPALLAMKRNSKSLKQHLDRLYIDRSLSTQLKNTPLFRHCSDTFIKNFKNKVNLVSFRRGQVIGREGDTANAVFLIRSGFVKLTQKMSAGEIVVNYLSKGMTFGEAEFFVERHKLLNTAISVENTELVKISYDDFKTLVVSYPQIEQQVWESSVARLKETGASRRNIGRSEFLNHAIDYGLVEGSSVLVIDLAACTRCDDCVRGCADTHDGLPRFVREGEKYDDFLVTRACFHCQDPVCLIGCPTGAIRRAGVADVVEIDADLCIGCKACFVKCPYDAITMVDSRRWGAHAQVKLTQRNISEFASKCDLCYATNHEPACVYNCPHGCAIRVEGINGFDRLLAEQNSMKPNRKKPALFSLVKKKPWFSGFAAAVGVFSVIYSVNLSFSEANAGNSWGLFHGCIAAILMVATGLYGIRRRWVRAACDRHLGSARMWARIHVYGGLLFMLLVFMHTGFRVPTGTFYLWLWSVSIWVNLSGVFGVFVQRWLPKMLSSGLALEVIYERIAGQVSEIKKSADDLVSACSEPVKNFYVRNVAAELRSPRVNLTYYINITGGIQRQMKQFAYLKSILSEEERAKLDRLEMMFKSKLELDAHYTIQKMLRWWLYLHLPVSLLLMLLVCIHLFAVFYY